MLSPDRPFLISPPFGSYLRHPRAYSVLGSFTRHPRPGRTLQVLRTVRPLGREPDGSPKGWLNKVGLRNPGWDVWPKEAGSHFGRPQVGPKLVGALADYYCNRVISLAPLEESDWHVIERWLDERYKLPIVEINISCPNVDSHMELPNDGLLERMIGGGATVIFKLSPVPASVDAALRLADLGARYVHLSNTFPTPAGGISGPLLREVNLPLVEKVATVLEHSGLHMNRMPDGIPVQRSGFFLENAVEVIAGGGIYSPENMRRYRDAGATRFSLSTAWFNPIRALRVMKCQI